MSSDRKIYPGGQEYPKLLSEISAPPKQLHIQGMTISSDIPAVGIVGARNPTPYGRYMSRVIAGGLASRGVTVVSGFARGIDSEAHRAALDNKGLTIAVLGCGLDIDYPRGSGELRKDIVARGTLVSEFDTGTHPLPGNFPARNRIISGLSLAVVVVQAGLKSGSLITARWALDQGREVLAVPGRADDPLSAGPISLMRDGAAPVCNADEVLDALGLECLESPTQGPGADWLGHDRVMNALKPGPRLPEDLAQATGLPLPHILSELSRLEIQGLVVRDDGGLFSLK